MMKNILLLFLFLPFVVSAQVDESDSIKLKADLSVTGFWQGGNVETIIFIAKSEASYQPWKRWVYKTKNSYVYQEFGNVKADEDILSLNFLYFNPHKKFYPLLLGFVSTNFRREIKLRSLVGGGFTYQPLKKEKDWLKLSITSEYEQTEFNKTTFNEEEYNGNTDINILRGTIWVNGKYHIFDKKLIFTHESYYQPSLEEGNNYRWQADVGVELPITNHLNFKINYLHTFESIVIAGQKQEDTFLTFGLSIKSY